MILIVPAVESGRGGGHLSRCITLVKNLRELGKDAFLFLSSRTDNISKLINLMNLNQEFIFSSGQRAVNGEKINFIILDKFQTSASELLYWKKIAPVIGIDEGGKYRDSFDFLIDILIPKNFYKTHSNITSPELIIKNINRKDESNHNTCDSRFTGAQKNEDKLIKILISFGHEDNSGLGLKTLNKLLKIKTKKHFDITLLNGSLNTTQPSLLATQSSLNTIQSSLNNLQSSPNTTHSIKILDAIPNLAEHLYEYDIVITHYGLTAYEALLTETAVFLAHPTKYHKKLANYAGFKTFSIKNFNEKANRTKDSSGSRLDKKETTLAELICTFSPAVNKNCTVCKGKLSEKTLARFNDRAYRKCIKCGAICLDRITPAPIEYEKEYFFEKYQEQYGKTYLEDFDNIKQNGKSRLKFITKIFSKDTKNLWLAAHPTFDPRTQREGKILPALLDIGCAYGPFLSAAKEAGFSPTGIDPVEDAVRYVNEKLGITAINSLFPAPQFLFPASYDVITMWYTIEHFTDCSALLNEIKKLLKPNGILAFSTPSFSGISGRKNLRRFLSSSPADHLTIWSPKQVKKALILSGFKVKKIVAVGHHPERFPLLGKFADSKKSFIYKILFTISRLFKLGDTFEVYAQKI